MPESSGFSTAQPLQQASFTAEQPESPQRLCDWPKAAQEHKEAECQDSEAGHSP